MRHKQETEETILELQGRKSNLLLEAQMLVATGSTEEAIERYALAAPLEKRIANFRARNGQKELAARHRFSAAVCYAKSGSLRDALLLFDALGRNSDTPAPLKVDALLLAGRLRQQQRDALQAYAHPRQAAA